jgi:hypothetical protein
MRSPKKNAVPWNSKPLTASQRLGRNTVAGLDDLADFNQMEAADYANE